MKTTTYTAANFTATEKEHAEAIFGTAQNMAVELCRHMAAKSHLTAEAIATTPMARKFFTDSVAGVVDIVAKGRGLDAGRLTAAVNAAGAGAFA